MKPIWNVTALPIVITLLIVGSAPVLAQVSQETLDTLSTPDKVESSIGSLEFQNGNPTVQTAEKVFDALAFTRALERLQQQLPRRLGACHQKGLQSIGAERRRHRHLLESDGLQIRCS